jgi:predicted Fe-S protein YdhL (DUF1289 family)
MPLFPKVQSPCPYKSRLAAVMDGDFCRMCERQVFDLTALSYGERRAFLAGCEEEVCVSYRLPLRGAMAAAALAAATASPAGAAGQSPVVTIPPVELTAEAEVEDEIVPEELSLEMIIVGGIKDPANAEFVDLPEDESVPELPAVYEDEPAADIAAKAAKASATRP